MANLLKVTQAEIAWQMKSSHIDPGPQANTRLKEYLGDLEKYFSPISLSGNGYVWTTPETGWTSLAQANPVQKQQVDDKLSEIRKGVRQKLAGNEKLADGFLSLPSDTGKYIFFKEDDKGFHVMIAGWGFANSRRQSGAGIRVERPKEVKSDVRVGFMIKGEIQPNQKFYLTTFGGHPKEDATDSEGYCNLGELKVGTPVTVTDADSGKSFSFTVEDGKSDYVFDVTRLFHLLVTVLRDETGVADKEISVIFKGKEFTLHTDTYGKAEKSLPFFPDTTIEVSVDGQSESKLCELPEISFEFKSTSPVVPPPPPPPPADKKSNLTVSCVDQFDNPISGYLLKVTIKGETQNLLTNTDGTLFFESVPYDSVVTVADGYGGSARVSERMAEGANEIVITIFKEVKQVYNILQMVNKDGFPFSNQKVALRQDDKTIVLDLDESGSARFKANEFIDGKEMTAQVLSPDSKYAIIPFTTEPDEREYVIQEAEGVKNSLWAKVLSWAVLIAIYLGLAIFGIFYVHQLP